MALLKPSLDFDTGVLRIQYVGPTDGKIITPQNLAVPLSMNPSLFKSQTSLIGNQPEIISRICGDTILASVYAAPEINDFFTNILSVPCALARFPPGGQDQAMRLSKLRNGRPFSSESSISTSRLPSPPDSDTEPQSGKLLLANESPILVIHDASVQAVSSAVQASGGRNIPAASFRGNIVVGGGNSDSTATQAYGEEQWQRFRIRRQEFLVLGPCQRCQMVCVNQQNGEKDMEPFTTLAKTRRVAGKVFFGLHAVHVTSGPNSVDTSSLERQHPFVQVGDEVHVTVGATE